MTQLATASHNLGSSLKFGSTPREQSPVNGNMNALEVIGEGILLLLAGKSGKVTLYFEGGCTISLNHGSRPNSLVIKGL